MLYWRDHVPAAYARIEKFLALNAYLAGKLAALSPVEAFTDRTFSAVHGAMNALEGDCEPDLLQHLNLPASKLPRVLPSEAVVGWLDERLAGELGLPRRVPVLAGAGDGAAAYAGSGMHRQGLALDLAGTSCAIGACSDRFLPDPRGRLFTNMKLPTAPGWLVIYVNHFGRTHRWFIDTFCPDLVAAGGAEGAYAAMDAEAATVEPGSGGLLAGLHLSGRMSPPQPHMRGAWLGFGLGYTRAHFYRALLEAHIPELAQAAVRLRELSPDLMLQEVVVAGEACSVSF